MQSLGLIMFRISGGRGRGRGTAIEPEDIEFLGLFNGGKVQVTTMALDASTSQVPILATRQHACVVYLDQLQASGALCSI